MAATFLLVVYVFEFILATQYISRHDCDVCEVSNDIVPQLPSYPQKISYLLIPSCTPNYPTTLIPHRTYGECIFDIEFTENALWCTYVHIIVIIVIIIIIIINIIMVNNNNAYLYIYLYGKSVAYRARVTHEWRNSSLRKQ